MGKNFLSENKFLEKKENNNFAYVTMNSLKGEVTKYDMKWMAEDEKETFTASSYFTKYT